MQYSGQTAQMGRQSYMADLLYTASNKVIFEAII